VTDLHKETFSDDFENPNDLQNDYLDKI